MATYCEYCNSHPGDTFNKNYHDSQYGFLLSSDDELFERLVLEIKQAGLFHYFDRFLAEYEGRFEKECVLFRPIIKEFVYQEVLVAAAEYFS
jgi:hypothetical protein